ncbi:MAG TPA: hypothetical protein VH593_14990, partial [Ktedonobacteraceae bacterium]
MSQDHLDDKRRYKGKALVVPREKSSITYYIFTVPIEKKSLLRTLFFVNVMKYRRKRLTLVLYDYKVTSQIVLRLS